MESLGPVTGAYVTNTVTDNAAYLSRFIITDGVWSQDTLGNEGIGTFPSQQANMELRADNDFFYFGLPQSQMVQNYYIEGDTLLPPLGIDMDRYNVDLALVPYSSTVRDRIRQIKDILDLMPFVSFASPVMRNTIINLVEQIDLTIGQSDVIGSLGTIINLETQVKNSVSDPILQDSLVKAIAAAVSMLKDSYVVVDDPVTALTFIKTIVVSLPVGSFTGQGGKNQVIGRIDELEQKLTTDKYYLATERANVLTQLIATVMIDSVIQPILIDLMATIEERLLVVSTIFENAASATVNLQSAVTSLPAASFTNNGGRTIVLQKAQQLNSMLTDHKVSQSFTKADQLSEVITQKVSSIVDRAALLQQVSDIRTIVGVLQ